MNYYNKKLETHAPVEGTMTHILLEVNYVTSDPEMCSIIEQIIIRNTITIFSRVTIQDMIDLNDRYVLHSMGNTTPEYYTKFVNDKIRASFPGASVLTLSAHIPYQILLVNHEHFFGVNKVSLKGELYYQDKMSLDNHVSALTEILQEFVDSKCSLDNFVNGELRPVIHDQNLASSPKTVEDVGSAIIFWKRVIIEDDFDETIDKILGHRIYKYRIQKRMMTLCFAMGLYAFIWSNVWDIYYLRVWRTRGQTWLSMRPWFIVWSYVYLVLAIVFSFGSVIIASDLTMYAPLYLGIVFTCSGMITGWISVAIYLAFVIFA